MSMEFALSVMVQKRIKFIYERKREEVNQMPCKYCHKPKEKKSRPIVFKLGKRYLVNGNEHICAQVDYNRYALISLADGNRYSDPVENINRVNGVSSNPIVLAL